MKKVSALITILSLLSPSLYAEPTPTGAQATFVTPDGQSHTYYDINGNALPMGTRIFLGLDGRGGSIIDESGRPTGQMAFDSTERASYWKDREAESAAQTGSGFVAGPAVFGPVGSGSSSGSSTVGGASAVAYDEAAYNEINYQLVVLIYGANEIGAKSCKGAGAEQPGSLTNWWKAVKTYAASEAKRDILLRDRVNFMKGKLQALTESKGQGKELQIEAIQAQIDLLNASIDSLAGSSFYSADGKGSQASGSGRIPIREKLILAALASNDKNSTENNKNVTTYKEVLIENGLNASLKVAQDACERKTKKKEKTCESVTTSPGGEAEPTTEEVCTEVEKEVLDPVPGCDVVKSTIPELRSGPVQAYGEIYLLPRIPSKEINDKMGKLEVTMQSTITGLPKSDDANYDWSSPMENGIKQMIEARKKAGAICPGNTKETFAKAVAEAVSTNITNPAMLPAGIAVATAGFAADHATVSKSSEGFLMAMGFASSEEQASEMVNPKPPKEGEQAPLTKSQGQVAAENFIETWNAVDQVIGQAGNRGTYFGEISAKATQLLGMDKAKLSELLNQKAKLEKYLADLKKALANPTGTKNSLANAATPSSPTKAPVQLGSSNVNTIGVAGISEVGPGQTIKIGSGQSAPIMDAAQYRTVSVGGPANPKIDFGYTALPGGTLMRNNLGLSSNAISSADKLNSNALANNKKTKDLLAKTFTTPTAGTTGSNKLSSFKESMDKSFTKVKNQPNSKELYKTAAIASPFDIEGDSLKSASDANTYAKDSSYGRGSNDDYSPSYSGGGTLSSRVTVSSSKSTTSSTEKTEKGKKASTRGSSGFSGGSKYGGYKSEESLRNARTLSESIKAKKSKNPEQFATDEEDSLFSRVTKAYIRNYEKVEDTSLDLSEE